MKKTLLLKTMLAALGVAVFTNTMATVHTVHVQDFSFNPASMSVIVGDTVRWVRMEGTHTTTSGVIPFGATAWDSDLDAGTVTFDYKVLMAGTYNYVCTPHAGNGMVGVFTASTAIGLSEVSPEDIRAYPNPFTDAFFVETGDAKDVKVMIYDLLGKQVTDYIPEAVSGKIKVEAGRLTPGIYMVVVKGGEGLNEKTIRLVKSGN